MSKFTFSKAYIKWLIIICCFSTLHSYSQSTQIADTLSFTLPQAEQRFLDSNFALLAQRYNIDAQQALIIQAKLLPNPNLTVSQGFYNPLTKQFLPFGSTGETQAGLSQLIQLAGKRNKQIKIAEADAKLSEYQFYDLIRTLKYTLRTDFFNIYYLQQSAKAYNEEITSLQQVVKAFNEQEGKGYISEKEVIRIKAQLYSLQSEYNDLINQINDTQSELRLALRVNQSYINPVADTNAVAALDPAQFTLSTLIDSAYNNRTDLMIAKANIDISKLNYAYQKSLAVPDLTLAATYDQQGSYVNNFNSIGFGIDIPLFNRNQGNIKSAKSMIDVNTAAEKNVSATVEENVYRALQKAIDEDKLYKNIDPKFSADFERLMLEVLINYQKRNLSLLDFLDFYDSYKQNILQINSIKFNKVSAFEDLNFYTGTNFFNEK
jgi:cobalt-zinc-cadmium efflux system outer membrane protein